MHRPDFAKFLVENAPVIPSHVELNTAVHITVCTARCVPALTAGSLLTGKSDRDIIDLQRRLEGVRAPLGLSSENSSVLYELLFKPFQHTMTNKIEESPIDKVQVTDLIFV